MANFIEQAIDPKVLSWTGKGGYLGLEAYERVALNFRLGLKQDEKVLAAPKLWGNTRGEAQEALFKHLSARPLTCHKNIDMT